ncbi:hypothetical protein, partial [Pseudomonas reactans]|uniref:hypothetical protein n=1 Tax=Pseudomonas reactans TaxID=117680 RepID=UPI001C42FB52
LRSASVFNGAPQIKSDSLRIVDTRSCRSRLAGEKREIAAFCLIPRVIVEDHRRQAGSYSDLRLLLLYTTQAGC